MSQSVSRGIGLRRPGAVGEQAFEALLEVVAWGVVELGRAPRELFGDIVFELPVPTKVEATVFVEHERLYSVKGPVPEEEVEHLIPLGQAETKRPGRDLTIVAWSFMVHDALKAAEALEHTPRCERAHKLRPLNSPPATWTNARW